MEVLYVEPSVFDFGVKGLYAVSFTLNCLTRLDVNGQ
jgi:hypothetical protein